MRRWMVVAIAVTVGTVPARSDAQSAGSTTAQTAKGELTVLVPPQGGTARVPVTPHTNVVFTFPEPLSKRAVVSTADWEIKDLLEERENAPPVVMGVYVRATSASAKDTTLALSTKTGTIRVNVLLTVASSPADAVTLARFKASTAEEAFLSAVQAEVERQTASLRAEVAEIKRAITTKMRERLDDMIGRRVLARDEQITLDAHDRNDENVIVHVERVRFLGEDAWLVFEIQNRSGAPYRLAKVEVKAPGGKDHAGQVSVLSMLGDDDSGVLGVVGAGARGRVAVALRKVDNLLAKPLVLTISEPAGRGEVTVRRGIVLR
jgi:hypothetical protein